MVPGILQRDHNYPLMASKKDKKGKIPPSSQKANPPASSNSQKLSRHPAPGASPGKLPQFL